MVFANRKTVRDEPEELATSYPGNGINTFTVDVGHVWLYLFTFHVTVLMNHYISTYMRNSVLLQLYTRENNGAKITDKIRRKVYLLFD